MTEDYKSLFIQQSYLDATELYSKILAQDPDDREQGFPVWDYVVLSASNEAQADSYRRQIDWRLANGQLPRGTKYAVLPDPDGKRVGSGGATLNVLRYIHAQEQSPENSRIEALSADGSAGQGKTDFSSKRILVLHSGGDAKRTPQYSACGKIFSPVPRLLPSGRRSSLFDEFMIGLSGIPSRISGGMLVCSGDALLLFNSLQLDFYGEGAAALSIKENVEVGKDHGVFLGSDDGCVARFLHKQTVGHLQEMGAVDRHGNVDLDTGAVLFSSGMVKDLFSLVDTDEKFAAMVNEHVRLSFYADFLYPLAEESTLEDFYKEQPEGDFSPELDQARKILWDRLHDYRMKLVRFSPASFLHFGTTAELLQLMTTDIPNYRYLGWSGVINSNIAESGPAARKTDYSVSGSYISRDAEIGAGSYIEDSYVLPGTKVGKQCVISGMTLENVTVPDHTVLHGLKLADGRFVVRRYGVTDNPKQNRWFGETIDGPLWTKPLFPVRPTMAEAVRAALGEAGNADDRTDTAGAVHAEDRTGAAGAVRAEDTLLSLRDSFNQADASAILPWQARLNDRIESEKLLQAVDSGTPLAATGAVLHGGLSERAEKILSETADQQQADDPAGFGRRIRILYYLSRLTGKRNYQDACFDTIRDTLLRGALQETGYRDDFRIVEEETVTRLPVRVNWGGGWSDTPPYCMEHGGTVLNAAITLDGKQPIEVTLQKRPEKKIILASTDTGGYKEFTELPELQDCHDPMDAFALHKAALIACGVINARENTQAEGGSSVEEVCSRLGGGFYMNTRVINIPKGSGLGTSSILAGACVKGLYRFMGRPISDNDLYNRVLCMEQIMSTGGGWQDQVGGLAPGIKMVTADPGLQQKILCTPVRIADSVRTELNARFALIYTGQRRLARNLLRDIVGKYIGNDPDAVQVLYRIQQVAVLMRFELEKGNIDGFAELLNEHWELSKKLDAGCTNTCIDQIFLSVEDLIDGRMICGAGGGGFVQVIMKKGVTRETLQDRLDEVFANSGVGVWNAEIL
jgi:fucokinase